MSSMKKTVSVVLAIMMILCSITALSFSAGAATVDESSNVVNVSSNIGSTQQYVYDEKTEQITVTYYFQSDLKLMNVQAVCNFDNSILKLASTNTVYTCLPVLNQGSTFINLNLANRVNFNCSNLNLYDFSQKAVLFQVTFDVIGTGVASVNLNVGVITATTADNYDELDTAEDVDLVYYDYVNEDAFVIESDAEIIQEEEPTTEEPTTEAPTTEAPTTEAPTTEEPTEESTTEAPTTTVVPTTNPDSEVPTDGYYVIANDFNLKLTACGKDRVAGTIALKAGQYTLKLDNYGTLLGYTKTVTNTSNGLTFSTKYKGSVTLNASGGLYTFQVDTPTNTLVIKYNNTMPTDYIIGDIHAILTPVPGNTTLSIGTAFLDAGKYSFKINSGDDTLGYGGTTTDSTNGKSISFSTKYKSSYNLIASGGSYTFTFNNVTKKLQISYIPSKDEAKDDVHISGDFSLVLDDNGGNSDVAAGTTTLEAGTYAFVVYSYGVSYTAGVKITDFGLKNLSSSNKASVTLFATGGTYNFQYNKKTHQLIVTRG